METIDEAPPVLDLATAATDSGSPADGSPADGSPADGSPVDARTAKQTVPERSGRGRSSTRREAHKVTRWLHTYLSMISLALVLFFGATGITLNHPSWTLGTSETTQAYSGTLPDDFNNGGNVDFLAVSQFMQNTHNVRGDATDYSADATQGSMSFKGPGYAADLFFDVGTGTYDLNVDQHGLLAVMNDLHKGRNTGGSWGWTIDIAGGVLVAVAATGIALQFFLTRRRTRAYVVASAGVIATFLLVLLTIN